MAPRLCPLQAPPQEIAFLLLGFLLEGVHVEAPGQEGTRPGTFYGSREGSPSGGDFGFYGGGDLEPLGAPNLNTMSPDGIAPRDFTDDERIVAYEALDGNIHDTSEIKSGVVNDPNAIGAMNSMEQEVADMQADEQFEKELAGLEEAERDAVLAHHDLRGRIS